jgi:hypothetical protein
MVEQGPLRSEIQSSRPQGQCFDFAQIFAEMLPKFLP